MVILKYGYVFLCSIALIGCGSDSDSNSDESSAVANVGVYSDAAVEGLTYITSPGNLSGTTNSLGEFDYINGDSVEFSIGSLKLPSVKAESVLTPVDMVEPLLDSDQSVLDNQMTKNIASLLQSLDSDGNPDNGITISATAISNINDMHKDYQGSAKDFFDLTPDDFKAEIVKGYVDEAVYVDAEKAIAHLQVQYDLTRGLLGSWIGENSEKEIFMLSFYDDTYVHVQMTDSEPEFRGLEWGEYAIDSDGDVTVGDIFFDQNGEIGLSNLTNDKLNLTVDKNTLLVVFEEDGQELTSTLTRVENKGFYGTWLASDAEGLALLSFTFLPDGKYIHSEVEDGSSGGAEYGMLDLTSNAFTVKEVFEDLNGDIGLHNSDDGTTVSAKINVIGNNLEFTFEEDDGETDVITFKRPARTVD
ncbi:hypothetical protein ACQKPX_20270 [Photobacterium sp. DNB23_23_1]